MLENKIMASKMNSGNGNLPWGVQSMLWGAGRHIQKGALKRVWGRFTQFQLKSTTTAKTTFHMTFHIPNHNSSHL